MSRQIGDLDPVDVEELDLNDLLAMEDVSEPKTKKLKLSELATLLHSVQIKIGDLYFNADNPANPNETLGFGTWELYSKGRMPIGVDPANPKYATGGITGGSETVTLTEAQMPRHRHTGTTSSAGSHSHTISSILDNLGGGSTNNALTSYPGANIRIVSTKSTNSAGSHSHSFTTSYSGSGEAHENMSPFITVYIWKRTG